jgi:uncharacterized protein
MHKIIIVLLGILLIACNSTNKDNLSTHKYTNELIHESSPYLLQHAHNPVNWKPYGTKALEESKASQKLMIISVGYAACHWCHVMEKESFEDSTVAAVMNEHYISIKVDREERPDVDQTYINAVQLMTGNAGWPLNVITLPDGRPVFGGTYFRKEEWIQALQQIQALYESEPQKLVDYASRLEEGIKSMDLIARNSSEIDFTSYQMDSLMENWKHQLDTIDGGNRGAPKFMMPNQLQTLMRLAWTNKDVPLQNYVQRSLHKMAYGGLYDQIGGGFARYSTDDKWHIPHFEKMLYDNAQLVSLYSQAFKLEPNPLYEQIVKETLAFIANELTHPDGVFYSSLDADSHNAEGVLEEGAFYTYTLKELQQVISEDWELFESYYNVNEYGKWEEENKYVLIRTKKDEDIARDHGITVQQLAAKTAEWKSLLSKFRNERDKPRLDDKSLTSWNALMIKGYVDAYKAFQQKEFLDIALLNANFIKSKQIKKDGSLYHTYKEGKSNINGYLEDYASVIDAFMALYEVTLDKEWLLQADQLAAYTFAKFFDSEKHMFYFTSSEDATIISRTMDYRDNVIPSSNSILAKNLFRLAHHFDHENYRETAIQMLKNVQPEMEKYPVSFSNWVDLLSNYQSNYYEVVIVGKDALLKLQEINKAYYPNIMIAGSERNDTLPLLLGRYSEEKTLIYVCVNNTCKLPVNKVEDALLLLK